MHDTHTHTGGLIPNKIIKKYGREIFLREILVDNIMNLEELNLLEIEYIEKFDTFNNGYNLTPGGDGGGSWVLLKTAAELEVIADKKRQKMIGREFSQDTRNKMSEAKLGKALTEQHKQNIIASQSGENHPWFGRKHTSKTKEKISVARRGIKNPGHSEWMIKNNPAMQPVSIEGVVYESMSNAAKTLNITLAIVKYRCKSANWNNWLKLEKNVR